MEKLNIEKTDLKLDILMIYLLMRFTKMKLSIDYYRQKYAEKTLHIIAGFSILICFLLLIYEYRNYFYSLSGLLTVAANLLAISICVYLKRFKRFSAVYTRNKNLFSAKDESDSRIIGNTDNAIIEYENNFETIIEAIPELPKKFEELFDSNLKIKIIKIIKKMNLKNKIDLVLLFSYVQYFILKNKVGNAKMIRQISTELSTVMPTDQYYGAVINKLFEWNQNESKIKKIKSVFEKSQYYERFTEITNEFDGLK